MNYVSQAYRLANKLRKRYAPGMLLSENAKTCISINMPIKGHCLPTKRCVNDCYGKSGHTALPSNTKKQRYVSNYITEGNMSQLIYECSGFHSVRLNGIGDLNDEHLPGIFSLAEAVPQTTFWGMTRKPSIADKILERDLPNLSLLVSVDTTSPDSVWKYQSGPLCFGPRRPEDKVPDDDRIITIFPRHHAGRIIGNVPIDPKDCPAVRHTVTGCIECKRCWDWW